MKHIIGYSPVSYQFGELVIPGKSVNRSEKDVIGVDEAQLKLLEKNATFNALLANGSIKVLDTKPSWAVSSVEKIQGKDDALKAEKAKTAALEAELAKLKAGK